MSSFYSGSGEHIMMPLWESPDKWNQYRAAPSPVDPASSPSSSFSPTVSLASSPRSPRDSPTFTRQLGELALGNGSGISISPQPTQASLHQPLLDGRINTSRGDNIQPVLGPSFTRRSQALSTDGFQGASGPTAMSTAPYHEHGFEYRGSPIGPTSQGSNQLSHSRPHISMLSMLPQGEDCDPYGLGDFPLAFPSELELYTSFSPLPAHSTADAGLNDVVDFPSHPVPVPQLFESILPPLPLPAPHQGQPDYSRQAPAEPTATRGSGSKHSDWFKVWKCYFDNFKHNQPFLRVCEQQFKARVGSDKTSEASLKKRKDEGQWDCPLGCKNFTRKQNLKLHLQSHLGIKDCACICDAIFNAHSGLKRHQKKCRIFLSSTGAA